MIRNPVKLKTKLKEKLISRIFLLENSFFYFDFTELLLVNFLRQLNNFKLIFRGLAA